MKTLSKADNQRDEDKDSATKSRIPYLVQAAFSIVLSELDTVIADLAACSFDLQMVNIM